MQSSHHAGGVHVAVNRPKGVTLSDALHARAQIKAEPAGVSGLLSYLGTPDKSLAFTAKGSLYRRRIGGSLQLGTNFLGDNRASGE